MKIAQAQDITVRRMYLSNSIVNPLLYLLFYASGSPRIRNWLCCGKGKNDIVLGYNDATVTCSVANVEPMKQKEENANDNNSEVPTENGVLP